LNRIRSLGLMPAAELTRRQFPQAQCRPRVLRYFTMLSRLMVHGWMSMAMAAAGSPLFAKLIAIGSLTLTAGAGFIVTADGTGNRITRGAGPHFIMAAGSGTPGWAGVGVRMMCGRHRGCAGAIPMI